MPKQKAYKIGRQPTELEFEKALMFFPCVYVRTSSRETPTLYSARRTLTGSSNVFRLGSIRFDFGSRPWEKTGGRHRLVTVRSQVGNRRRKLRISVSQAWRKAELRRDMEVGHLFFDHRNNLRRVDLRYAHGNSMKEFFSEWLKNYLPLCCLSEFLCS